MFLQHGDQVSTRGRGFMGIAEKDCVFLVVSNKKSVLTDVPHQFRVLACVL